MTKSEEYNIKKGRKPLGSKKCVNCGIEFKIFVNRDIERKKYCSKKCFGIVNIRTNKLVPPRMTEETRAKVSKIMKEKISMGLIPKPPSYISRLNTESERLLYDLKITLYCEYCAKPIFIKSKCCKQCFPQKRIKFYKCINCETIFKERASSLKISNNNIFCSDNCLQKWKSLNVKSKKEKYLCSFCNKEYIRFPSQVSGEKNFCSTNCRFKGQTVKKGKESLFYIDGRTPFRKLLKGSRHYKDWCKSIYKKFNYKCSECGSNKKIHAHHIIKFSDLLTEFLKNRNIPQDEKEKYSLLEEAYNYAPFWNIDNGICLCKDCHQKKHPEVNLFKN